MELLLALIAIVVPLLLAWRLLGRSHYDRSQHDERPPARARPDAVRRIDRHP